MAQRLRNCSALLSVLVLSAVLVQGCSSNPAAHVSASAPVSASGSVHCSKVTGSVGFSPPLTTKGAAAETTTVSLKLARCSPSGSNVSVVSSGLATSTYTSGTSVCADLIKSRALTVNTTWSPTSIKPSVVTFSGFSLGTNSADDSGFVLPGKSPNPSAKVVGSFAGSNHGASSTALVYANEGATQLVGGCSKASGLASITVGSGVVTLG